MPALAAGMLPGSKRWHQVLLRPGGQAMSPLDGALETTEGDEDGTRHVLVVVDQFEEIVTACRDDAERAAFVSAITAAPIIATAGSRWYLDSGRLLRPLRRLP